MRKSKPKKKREIKHSTSGPTNTVVMPPQEELDSIELRMHLLNLATVVERHQKIWKDEEDGCLAPYYLMLMGRVKWICSISYAKAFGGRDVVGNDPYTKLTMAKTMTLCASAIGDPPPLSQDDIVQNLPRGFMGTLGAWARITKVLREKRWIKMLESLGIEKRVAQIIQATDDYFKMVYKEITRNELIGGFQL